MRGEWRFKDRIREEDLGTADEAKSSVFSFNSKHKLVNEQIFNDDQSNMAMEKSGSTTNMSISYYICFLSLWDFVQVVAV